MGVVEGPGRPVVPTEVQVAVAVASGQKVVVAVTGTTTVDEGTTLPEGEGPEGLGLGASENAELGGVLVALVGVVDEHDTVSRRGVGAGGEAERNPGELAGVGDLLGNGQGGLAVGGRTLAQDQGNGAGAGRVPGDVEGLAQGDGVGGVRENKGVTAGGSTSGSRVLEGSREGVGRGNGNDAGGSSEETHFDMKFVVFGVKTWKSERCD